MCVHDSILLEKSFWAGDVLVKGRKVLVKVKGSFTARLHATEEGNRPTSASPAGDVNLKDDITRFGR